MNNLDLERYVNSIYSNHDKLVTLVDSNFKNSKNELKDYFIHKIVEFFETPLIHYNWMYDGNPHDMSGIIISDGIISLNQTILEFLTNEYTGNQVATYTSNYGWNYPTYGDIFLEYSLEISNEILSSTIKNFIENRFKVIFSDEDFDSISEDCEYFDDIYTDSIASNFFDYEYVLKWLGIDQILLKTIIKN